MAKATVLPRGISVYRGRYRVRMEFAGGTVSLGMFDSLADAKAALTLGQAERLRGAFVSPAQKRAQAAAELATVEAHALTLAEWSEQWLAALEANPRRSKATVVSYRSVLRVHILPAHGHYRLVDLTPKIVADHLAALVRLPSTVHKGQRSNGIAPGAARILRSCLNSAVRSNAGGLEAFAFPEAPKPSRVRPKDEDGDIASPAEVDALADAMPAHLRIGVLLAAYCSLRIGELVGLERRDLEHLDDASRATLHIRRQFNTKANAITRPKADSVRSIAIPGFLLEEIAAHLKGHTQPAATSPVLSTPSRVGLRVSQTALDKTWRAARTAAGRPLLRFHDLRHTGLTLYAQQGATMAELLHRGGHTDVSVALRYQHATAERDRALAQRLNETVTAARSAGSQGAAGNSSQEG